MAAEVPEAGMVALCVAVGCATILKPALGFLQAAPSRCPALDAPVLLVVLTVTMAYLAGVILLNLDLHLQVTPAAGTPVVLTAFRQFLLLVCVLLLFVACFLFLPAGGW